MATRIFSRPTTVLTATIPSFNPGERAKNSRRIGKRVMFEPASPHRVAGTYAMDWTEFEMSTNAIVEARA